VGEYAQGAQDNERAAKDSGQPYAIGFALEWNRAALELRAAQMALLDYAGKLAAAKSAPSVIPPTLTQTNIPPRGESLAPMPTGRWD
jgi:hypothetical protein